jgi:cytochrome P450
MRSVFYHLMKNPEMYAELRRELDEATASGKLSSPPSFAEASKLSYLCATIKEAMRLHPSVGLTMPRIVPAGGLEIGGVQIPAGYIIGMNAAVVGYDEDIYGADSHAFRPGRWLGEQAVVMDRHSLVFGAGTRTCIGKNVRHGLLQILASFADPEPARIRSRSVRFTNLFHSPCKTSILH